MSTLRLGDTAPDFTQDSTAGPIRFHEWAGSHWVLRFSPPAEIARRFPKGYRAVRPYLRLTPPPNK